LQHASFLTRKSLTKQHNCRRTRILLFSVSPIEDQEERRHFDTNEVMEAESPAELNTLTEHDFQDAFEKWQKLCEWHVRAQSRVMVASKP
jgi:hypothetical protein